MERINLISDSNIVRADELNKAGASNRIFDWAKPKSYRLEHFTEYVICFAAFLICGAISIYFSHYTLVNLAEKRLEYLTVIQIVSVLILIFTYFAEYSNVAQISRIKTINKSHDSAKMPISLMRWIGAIMLSLINISLIFSGVYFQTKETDKTVIGAKSSFSSDSLKIVNDFDNQISEYNGKIKDVKKMYTNIKTGELDYKGRTAIGLYDVKILDLRSTKDAALIKFQNTKESGLNEVKTNLNQFIWLKLIAAIILELIILASIVFIGHYKASVYVWEVDEQKKKEAELTLLHSKNTDPIAIQDNSISELKALVHKLALHANNQQIINPEIIKPIENNELPPNVALNNQINEKKNLN